MSDENLNNEKESSPFEIMNFALFLMEKNLNENLIKGGHAKEPSEERFNEFMRLAASIFSKEEKIYVFHNLAFLTIWTFIKCLNESEENKKTH